MIELGAGMFLEGKKREKYSRDSHLVMKLFCVEIFRTMEEKTPLNLLVRVMFPPSLIGSNPQSKNLLRLRPGWLLKRLHWVCAKPFNKAIKHMSRIVFMSMFEVMAWPQP